ncbi:MAG: hypothetical protein H0W90_13365 [Actinobacteria bacterium]|nr:hypothetical protein [Actinomycetota bacterium]
MSIVGTAHQEWSFTAAPRVLGDCRTTETSEGFRTVTFHTMTPTIVRLSGGRVLPAVVRRIAGTVTLDGANTTEELCGGVGTSKIADCAQTRRSFAGARGRVQSPRRGVFSLGAVTNVRLASADCPVEPIDVRRRPLGPATGLLRLPKVALTEQKVARITVRASRVHRKTYGSPEGGKLTERVEWTLTFVRIPG